jgi:long-chain acyl-CoA synthetase
MSESVATIAQTFEQQARKYGPRALLKSKQGKVWRDHSWNEISDAAARLRGGLLGLGVKPGDRIAILAENCPQWVIVDQAALGAGGVVVPLYTTSGHEETAHVLNDSGAAIVAVHGDEMVKKILSLAPELPQLKTIVATHSEASASPASNGVPSVTTLAAVSGASAAAPIEGRSEDLATFIYTSGTTGTSKGVMLTHGNILSNAEDSQAALDLNEADTTLSFLPVAHSFERTAGYYTVVLAGGTIAYAEGLGQIASNLVEINPTVVLTVPRLLEVIYGRVMKTVESSPAIRQRLFHTAIAFGSRAAQYRGRGATVPPHLALPMALFRKIVFARIKGLFGTRLRYLISGGAPLPVEINQFLSAAEVPIVEGYGLTEASPVVSVNLHGRNKIGTVGRALKRIETRTAPDGELLLRGPNIMKGYYHRDQDTAETIDSEGWLHTGDIASIDSDRFIKITDRKKEIIVLSGGKNVSPAYVEGKLTHDKYIAQAVVFGDRQKHLGALIVPDMENLADFLKENNLAGKPASEIAESSALRKLIQQRVYEVNKQLSDVEAVVKFKVLAEPFTQESGDLTPSLKVRRRKVAQHYKNAVAELFE